VRANSGITSARQLDGATVCVAPGSSTELAVADYFRLHNMKLHPLLIQDTNEIRSAYMAGRCDTYSTDASGLAGYRFIQGDRAAEHVLLPEVISKEPLGVMVRKGDAKFFDLVRWSMFVGLIAEEHGLTQANVDQALGSNVPEIRRLLGLEGDMGRALGVDNRFGYNIIKQVGSYADMWDRNIVPVGIARGINNLWNNGGLHYAPPMR
jgi:general L-amino acid transport system substrate-binding protein